MKTGWVAILKTGTFRDSEGREQTFTESNLDAIVSKYNPSFHEAPVVIGHPKNNSPAWGWVDSLKRDGQILYAKLKDLVPEFVDMVKKGMFKKRSIAVYSNGSLKHIGFLGATPPAVKGLPDYAFSCSYMNESVIEFSDSSVSSSIGDSWAAAATEQELLNKIADQVIEEMQNDRKLSSEEAIKRVLSKNPDIQKLLEEVENNLIREKITQGDIDDLLKILANDRMKNNTNLSFSEAFGEIQIEFPTLVRVYAKEHLRR
jgi:hypothetical protein